MPNVQLRAWRNAQQLTRAELAERINQTPVGIKEHLAIDEERIRRWEAGEVSWPRTPQRNALAQATGLQPEELGFSQSRRTEGRLIEARVMPVDALRAEADLYGTMELAEQLQASDVGETPIGPDHARPAPRTVGHHRMAYRPARMRALRHGRARGGRDRPTSRLRDGPPSRTRRTHGMGTRDVRLVRPRRRPI
ncbi:helix-turn-helix domain-containing protein [Planotetraspora silvatica]|uniref:helix-turn-helix domain-containing protein n=1 Tax=Planotetraspora silvatica TaxID=234614 RepID=UPI003CD0AE6F